MIISIAGMTKNRVIGKEGRLPWDIPEELNNFRKLTVDSTVVMGRKTYDSIGHPLPKRNNIVISRSMEPVEGIDICSSIEEALEKAKSYGKEIFIIGGSGIYAAFMPYVDKLYISWIKADYEGDTLFPEFEDDWEAESREDRGSYEFVIYKRKAK